MVKNHLKKKQLSICCAKSVTGCLKSLKKLQLIKKCGSSFGTYWGVWGQSCSWSGILEKGGSRFGIYWGSGVGWGYSCSWPDIFKKSRSRFGTYWGLGQSCSWSDILTKVNPGWTYLGSRGRFSKCLWESETNSLICVD